MEKRKTVLLLASLGTSILRAKEVSYDQIQADLALASGLPVWQVFTDDATARAMNGIGGGRVYTVEDALETAMDQDFTQVIAVPVFFGEGRLYRGLASRLNFYRDRIDLAVTRPAVYDPTSAEAVAGLLIEGLRPHADMEYLLVGYGSTASLGSSCDLLEQSFRAKGHPNIRVLKLSDGDCLQQAVDWLNARQAMARDCQVAIVPLVIAWGDYMAEALYNSEDAFMWQLRRAGFRTVFTGRGLGEYPAFRSIYTARLNEVIYGWT